MPKKLIINLFGGPCSGKSTCAAYVFHKLRTMKINVEMIFEFTKDLTYSTNITPPYNQAFVFGNQLNKIEKYLEHIDILIIDSPLLLSIVYNSTPYLNDCFNQVVLEAFNSFNNLNYLLDNDFSYSQQGRYQSEKEAKIIHSKIINMLENYKIDYKPLTETDYDTVINEVIQQINN